MKAELLVYVNLIQKRLKTPTNEIQLMTPFVLLLKMYLCSCNESLDWKSENSMAQLCNVDLDLKDSTTRMKFMTFCKEIFLDSFALSRGNLFISYNMLICMDRIHECTWSLFFFIQ